MTTLGEAVLDSSGNPVIMANPDLLKDVSPMVHEFWYAHECMHLAFSAESIAEYEADCYGVRDLRDLELLNTEDELEKLISELQNMPESLWPVIAHKIFGWTTCGFALELRPQGDAEFSHS